MKRTTPHQNSSKVSKGKRKFPILLALALLVPIFGFFINEYFTASNDRPRYWGICINNWNKNGNLRTMNRIFKRLGYLFVTPSSVTDFDVIWSIENPFVNNRNKIYKPLEDAQNKLLPHQRVNHFPAIYWLTNKGFLCTSTDSEYLLPSFYFPDQLQKFENFRKLNPKAKIVVKDQGNRGVRVVNVNEIDFAGTNNQIYQQFLENPFLIDGHAFDFGVYVLIASMNPLRVYRFAHENFIRFCPELYQPFDHRKRGKYVVDESHLAAYEMESFKESYLNYSNSFKRTFENIIKEKGFDVEKFWEKIDDAISSLILIKEPDIVKEGKEFLNSTRNSFELVRFDFVFQHDLRPFVMEVNMSPNLTPSSNKNYSHYALIYEQLIYNTLQLVSAGSLFELKARVSNDTIISNGKNIATNLENCLKNECILNCENPSCKICLPCVDDDTKFNMHDSYREHSKRGNFKRIYPSISHFDDQVLYDEVSDNNKIMLKWFKAKCEKDESWC